MGAAVKFSSGLAEDNMMAEEGLPMEWRQMASVEEE